MEKTERDRARQERGLSILVKHKGGFQFTDTFFPYTSGEIGPYFVQSGVVQNNGLDYQQAIQDLANLIDNKIPWIDRLEKIVISGGETRDWIFSNPVSIELTNKYNSSIPHVMFYKDGKKVGADIKGKEVIHVADLNNEGSSPRDYWLPIIKQSGATIRNIFFYVDRMEKGFQVMQDLCLISHSVVPLDNDAWNYLCKKWVVTTEVYKNLNERGKTPEEHDVWARKMLKTDNGIARLVELFDDIKSREKVRKIIAKGYPDLKDELLDILRTKSESRLDINEWWMGL